MNNAWIATVAGMLVVTYSVRLVPFVIPRIDTLPRRLRRALSYVPPAALGALIIPDAMESLSLAPAVAALAVSALAYRLRPGIFVPVAAAVVFVAGALFFGAA